MEMELNPLVNVGLVVIVIIALLAFSYYYAQVSPWRIKNDEAEKLLRKKDFSLVMDVRTPMERQIFGFYPGSINVPISKLKKRIAEIQPNKNKKILVYCMSGQRAKFATNMLHKLGYNNAFYVTQLPVMQKSSPNTV